MALRFGVLIVFGLITIVDMHIFPGLDYWGWRVALIDQFAALSDFLLFLCLMMLMLWRAPSRELNRAYPFKVRMLWILPFSQWQRELAPQHVEAIRRYRSVFVWFFVALLPLTLLKFAYYKFLFVRLHTLKVMPRC